MAAVTDAFTRTDSTDLGTNWTPVSGTCKIVSNKARFSTGQAIEMWNANTFTADHYSQVLVSLLSSGFYNIGPAVRMQTANGGECYYVRACGSCGDLEIHSRIGFSDSAIASGGTVSTSTPVTPFTLKLEVVGSTLTVYVNGSSVFSTTNTGLTSQTNAGICVNASTSAEADDWQADAAGSTAVTATGSITSTGTLTGTGVIATPRTGSITGTGTLTATQNIIHLKTGSITSVGTLTATGVKVTLRDGSISGTGTLTGTGQVLDARTGSISGVGSLTGVGSVVIFANASLVGTGILTAVEKVITPRSGSINGIGSLSGTHNIIHFNTGSIVAAGLLTGSGIVFGVVQRDGSLVGVGTLAGTGILLSARDGSIVGIGTLTATGNIDSGIVQRSGAINGTGLLTGIGFIVGSDGTIVHAVGISMQALRPMCHVKNTVINSTIRQGVKG